LGIAFSEPERFHYYSDWKTKALHCRKCGWEGTFEKGYVEYFDEIADEGIFGEFPELPRFQHPVGFDRCGMGFFRLCRFR